MNDHERFLLLAAKRIAERLTREEEVELEAHLAACPGCRATAAGMRRDDVMIRAALAPVPVAPRVRRDVLDEVSGRHRLRAAGRLILVLAATLGLAVVGLPLISGGPRDQAPPVSPTPSPIIASSTPSPSPATVSPSTTVGPTLATGPSVAPTPVRPMASVNGSFTYAEDVPRRGGISVRLIEGRPDGAWSRRVPPEGPGKAWGGEITCLVVRGDDAWMAGPASVATDGRPDQAVFIHVHDGGADGQGDTVLMWLNTHGETLALLEGWCRDRLIPGTPFPLTSGDIAISAEGG